MDLNYTNDCMTLKSDDWMTNERETGLTSHKREERTEESLNLRD